jgi:hypothetical protein
MNEPTNETVNLTKIAPFTAMQVQVDTNGARWKSNPGLIRGIGRGQSKGPFHVLHPLNRILP